MESGGLAIVAPAVVARNTRRGYGARVQYDDLTGDTATGLTLPRTQPIAQILGLETERDADVLEGEDPGRIGILDPRLGVQEELLALAIAGTRLLAVDVDRVLE